MVTSWHFNGESQVKKFKKNWPEYIMGNSVRATSVDLQRGRWSRFSALCCTKTFTIRITIHNSFWCQIISCSRNETSQCYSREDACWLSVVTGWLGAWAGAAGCSSSSGIPFTTQHHQQLHSTDSISFYIPHLIQTKARFGHLLQCPAWKWPILTTPGLAPGTHLSNTHKLNHSTAIIQVGQPALAGNPQ